MRYRLEEWAAHRRARSIRCYVWSSPRWGDLREAKVDMAVGSMHRDVAEGLWHNRPGNCDSCQEDNVAQTLRCVHTNC